MKTNFYRLAFAGSILLTGSSLLAQDVTVSAKYNIGNAHYRRSSDNFQTDNNRMQSVGLNIAYAPFLAMFQFVSGAEYEMLKEGNLLTVPLGCRIFVGKKLRPYAEGGGYYSFVLHDNSKDDYQMQDDLGLRAGIGIEYAPTRWVRFQAGYFLQYGMRTMLKEEKLLPLQEHYFEEYKLKAKTFQFGLAFRF